MRRAPRLPAEKVAPFLLEEAAHPVHGGPAEAPIPSEIGTEAAVSVPLDWSDVFGNPNPVEIEVGFGKGLFLTNSGQAHPDCNFFGVEIERKYTLFTATRLAKRGLTNVKVACCDGRWFLRERVRAGSVAAVHVFFPDPWWKNRHRKRRLFTEEFAIQCVRVLATGGRLQVVSDVRDYFAETVEMLRTLPALAPLPEPAVKDPEHEMDFLTNFERKYRREGRPIYRGLWQKFP